MLTLLKLVQSLVKTLHSDGTPAQIAAGVALGAALGLTPIANVHNIGVFVLLAVLNVSFGAGLLDLNPEKPVGGAYRRPAPATGRPSPRRWSSARATTSAALCDDFLIQTP